MPTRREALEGFLAADPDDAFTRYALALEYASAGDTAGAERLLRETLARHADYIPAHHQLGRLLAAGGRHAEAADTFQRGIAAARAQRDMHAASEMQDDLDSLTEEHS